MQVWFLRGNNCWERWQKLWNINFFCQKMLNILSAMWGGSWTSIAAFESAESEGKTSIHVELRRLPGTVETSETHEDKRRLVPHSWREHISSHQGWKSTRDHCPSLPQVRHLLAVATTASTFHDGVSPNMLIIARDRTQHSPTQVQTKITKRFPSRVLRLHKDVDPSQTAQSSVHEVYVDYSSSEGCQRGHARWRSSTRVAASTSTDAMLVKCQIAHEQPIWTPLSWCEWM